VPCLIIRRGKLMRKILRNELIIVGISILFLTPFGAAHVTNTQQQSQLDNDMYQIEYTATFSEDDFVTHQILGYDCITLNDGYSLSDLGKPMLPIQLLQLALPSGMQAQKITIMATTSEELPNTYLVFPAQHPLKMSQTEDDLVFTEPDAYVYTSTAPYPNQIVSLDHESDIAGQAIATVAIAPMQYIPAERKIILYTSITFAVEGSDAYVYGDYLPQMVSETTQAEMTSWVQSFVANPLDVTLEKTPIDHMQPAALPPGGPYAHVIITNDANAPYWAPLVSWHTKEGYRDTVVTTSYIYTNYAGSDNQEKIRNFVIDAYTNWGTLYFLIGGEHSSVPFEYRTYEDENIPGDEYYADFDDDWDYEVFVGRVTAEGSTQINTFIDKVFTYEKNPPLTNYPLDVTLLGMDLTLASEAPYYTLTAGEELKEMVDSSYIPSRFVVTPVYDSEPTNHKTEFINALNDGQNLVNHNDHSNTNVMGTGDLNHNSYMSISDVNALTNNNRLSIIFSVGCHPNEMDADDCIAEHFVIYNDNQGAVAFNGNTRSGWFNVGDPDSLSAHLDRYWWRALFDQNEYRLGETLAWTKNACGSGTSVWKYCQWTLNLLGEPLMPIWTDTPKSFEVTYSDELPTGLSNYMVHVAEAGAGNVQNAYVCLYKDGEVYETGYTNANGDYTFSVAPLTQGDLSVTVTKQNYLPFEGTATVALGGHYPYLPSNPSPEDDTEYLMDFNTDLRWDGGDPQGDTVTYDVYFGTTNPPSLIASDILDTSYDPGLLDYDMTYYWRIVADDNNGSITYGPTWTFSTISQIHMRVEDTTAVVGQTDKIVNIYGSWEQPIKAYQIYLSFDTADLEFIDVEFTGTVAENADYSLGNEMEPGMLSFGAVWFVEGYPDAGTGLLAKIKFNIRSDAQKGDTPLDITSYNGNPSVYTDEGGQSIYPQEIDGILTITDHLCGDANSDSIINVSDAVYIINYVFVPGAPVPDPLCAADANGDTIINVSDAVYLINYVFVPGAPAPVTSCCS
jgi:hypothetical protein